MSYHKLTHKPLNASLNTLLKRVAHVGLGVGAFTPILALANPTGGQVVAGQATIAAQNANKLVITQGSSSAIINWQQFSINQGQYVQFLQPSSSSVVLNRVVGGNPTSIFGTLNANGQVFLVNPNGIFFGKSASLDVQGIVASTLDIADSDFLSGNYVFQKGSGAPDASVTNQGTIRTRNGGYIVLAGDYAENDGLIQAQSGHIILASGTRTTLTLSGNSLVNFAVNDATLAKLAGTDNTGSLIADGGTVIMTADVANLLKATVVNNTGLIEAHAINKTGGAIYLTAEGGNLTNAGTLDANAATGGHAGGDIVLKGDAFTDLTSTSKITATGMAADGGSLEISGNTIRVRGTANIGKGGNLLLDPNKIQLVTGNGDNPGTGAGTAAGADGAIGVGFIQSALDGGGNVAISAHSVISHSANAKAITATAGAGNLKFKVGSGGQIKLSGLTIDIAGGLTASGANAAMSFGRLTAKSIDIDAGTGDVHMAPEAVVSGVAKLSATATGGNISITAGHINALSSGSLNLSALDATADIDIHGSIKNKGNVTLGAGSIISGSKFISSDGNVKLTAKTYETNAGSLDVSAAGNIAIKGAIGADSTAGRFDASVNLHAGNTISLDHGIFLNDADIATTHIHSLNITGKHLAYTGAGSFVLSAGYGKLILDASIGSAAAPVKYKVKLFDTGYGIYIDRSIYAGGSIEVQQANFSSVTGTGSGAFVQNSGGKAVTLSAKGPISIEGARVGIGGSAAVTISADDGNPALKTDILKIEAYGTTNAYGVHVGGDTIFASNSGAVAKLNVNHSVTLHAGQDVDISGHSVVLNAATAIARASGAAVGVIANTDISITAGDDIKLTGDAVSVRAGAAISIIDDDSKSAVSVDAEANVVLGAGHDVTIDATAGAADMSGGYATVTDETTENKQQTAVVANATLSMTAGHDITASGAAVMVRAGSSAGISAHIFASQSGAKATATAHGDASLTAGNAIDLSGATVEVRGGAHVGGPSVSSGHESCAGHCSLSIFINHPSEVFAKGENATAALTATDNVSLSAGAGGITMSEPGSLQISAGYGAAQAIDISAGNLGGAKATADAEAKVMLSASGNITLQGIVLSLRGGKHALGTARNHSSGTVLGNPSYSSSVVQANIKSAAAGESAKLTVNSSVTVKAGGNIDVAASAGTLIIYAGSSPAAGLIMKTAGAKAIADATVNTSVNFTATKGEISVTDRAGQLKVHGALHAAQSASLAASFGANVGLAVDGGVHMSAHGAIVFDAKDDVTVIGEDDAGFRDLLHAQYSGAVATLSDLSDVTIVAGGAFSASAGSVLLIRAGTGAGEEASITAKAVGGNANESINAGVSIAAGGNVTLDAHDSISMLAGSNVAREDVLSGDSGGVVALTDKSAISITAGGNFLASAGSRFLRIAAAQSAGQGASITGNHGTATLTADGSVGIAAHGTLRLKADTYIDVHAGNGAASEGDATAIRGVALETALADVSLTAGGALSASAGSYLRIYAGDDAGQMDELIAKGTGAKNGLVGNAGVSIVTGGAITLKSATYLDLSGSNDAGYETQVHASSGAAATETAVSSLSIKAGGAFTATGGSNMLWSAGTDIGKEALVIAKGTSAKATLTADGGVTITATGAITLKAHDALALLGNAGAAEHAVVVGNFGGVAALTARSEFNITDGGNFMASAATKDINIAAGVSAGQHASVSADHGTASLTDDSGVHIVASGTITLMAHTNLTILGASEAGSRAAAAATDGKATATDLSDVTISAGGGFSADAGLFLSVAGANDAGYSAEVKAVHGTATLTANTGVDIAAGGAVTLTADSILSITAGSHAIAGLNSTVSHQARATASGSGAVASLSGDGSVIIKGKSMSFLDYGGSLSIYGGNNVAKYAKGSAMSHGIVKLVGSDTVDITASAAFSAKGAGSLSIYAGAHAGALSKLSATGAGANVSLTAEGAVNITANSVALSASSGLYIYGASAAGFSAGLQAANHGVAKQIVQAGVNITVTKSFTAALIGTHNSDDLYISGGGGAAGKLIAIAHSAGVASANINSAVNITVTGTGGTATIKTGTQTSTTLRIEGGGSVAYSAGVGANGGGDHATLTADNGVNISALGALTIAASHGALSIDVGANGGFAAHAVGSGAAAKATLTGNDSVNIKGGNVSLTDSLNLKIGDGVASAGAHAGPAATLGGVAIMVLDGDTDITATGNLSITAGDTLDVNMGGAGNAKSAGAETLNGGASASLLSSTEVNLKAGGNISLNATAGSIDIAGQAHDGSAARAQASHGGDATVTVNGGANIVAGGAFSAKAGTDLIILGGSDAGAHAVGIAAGAKAAAKLTAQADVSITAGGAVSLITGTGAGDFIEIHGSGGDAYKGGAAGVSGGAGAMTAESGVSIKAGSNLTVTAGGSINVGGGGSNAKSAEAETLDGGASANVLISTEVNLTAAGNISLTATAGSIDMVGQADDGSHALAQASHGGNDALTINAGDDITAGGAFSAKAGAKLIIHGGDDVGVLAAAIAGGTKAVSKLTAQANVSITAGGAVSLAAGTGAGDSLQIHGSGGDASKGGAAGISGGAGAMTAESVVSIKAGGNLTVTAGGPITIYAGAEAASFAQAIGIAGTAKLTAEDSVSLFAGGKMSFTLTGESFTVDGGSGGGRSAMFTGSKAGGKVTAIVDQTVNLTADGSLTETGADDVKLIAGLFPNPGSHAKVILTAGGAAAATINSGITIKGSSLNVQHTGTLTKTPATGLTSGGLIEEGAITIVGGTITSYTPPAPLSVQDSLSAAPGAVFHDALSVHPLDSGTSFGQQQSLYQLSTMTLSGPSLDLQTGSLTDGMRVTGGSDTPLSTLNDMALVTYLIAVANSTPAPALGDAVSVPATFVAEVDTRPYRDGQTQACSGNRLSAAGACLALK